MSWKSDIAPSSAFPFFGISASPSQLRLCKPTVRGEGNATRTHGDDLHDDEGSVSSLSMPNGCNGLGRVPDASRAPGAPCKLAERALAAVPARKRSPVWNLKRLSPYSR